MELFEAILAMLALILLSNVINRFIPSIAIPLIQVVLGILMAIFMSIGTFELSSELFMLLFLAPLLFNDGTNVNKKALWKERKAIFILSIVLVFITVWFLGMVIHWLIPQLPWAGSFALAAALAPTDPVAVSALAEKLKIPHKMMHTLEGEALINDASGLVSFQFASAALLTGEFSVVEAGVSFVAMSLGGILVGIILSFLAIKIVHWLRSLGIENPISYILLELLLPYFIFLTAEHLDVNGILAVVSAGLVYSTSYQKVNPETAQLQVLSKNTWSVFSFSLNGLVFILLGIQLPHVIHAVWTNNNVSNLTLIFYILLITTMLLGIRFICFWLFKNFEPNVKKSKRSRIGQTALYTISGVRGTITLVSALSLPVLIRGGNVFIERELLISIAGGVIITTLLLANFAMPFLAEKDEKVVDEVNHQQEIIILRRVVQELSKKMRPENQEVLIRVIKMYNDRIIRLNQSKGYEEKEEKLKELVLQWQLVDTLDLLKKRQVNLQVAFGHMRRLNRLLFHLTRDKKYRRNILLGKIIKQKLDWTSFAPVSFSERRKQRILLWNSNLDYVSHNLRQLDREEYPQEMITYYLTRYRRRDLQNAEKSSDNIDEWLEYAIQLERDNVQQAFELGNMTRGEVRTYRENLLAIESTIPYID